MAEIIAGLEKAVVSSRLRGKVDPLKHIEPFAWTGRLTAEFGPPSVTRPDGVKQWIFKDVVCMVDADGYQKATLPKDSLDTIGTFADKMWQRSRP